ncbi:hypothetical protein RI367_007787 [Sorochytrium milnesiophthora]
MPSDKGQHGPEYATLERLWQQLYHQATSLPRGKTYLRGCKYCHQTGRAIKQCPVLYQDELKTSDHYYDAALLEASWKFSNHYDQFLLGRADFPAAFLAPMSKWPFGEFLILSTTEVVEVADESESDISSVHTSDLSSDSDTAEDSREVVKPKTLEVALGSRNTRALCLRLHFKSPRNQDVIALALLDSGATHDLIDPRLLRKIGARKLPLAQPKATSMADGSTPAAAYIHHKTVDITYSSGQLVCTAPFYVMTLGHYDAILGMSFLRRYNPRIDWRLRTAVSTSR